MWKKLSYPGKLIRHSKKNLVEKILYYTLSFILPSFYNVLNRQRGLSSHKRSPVECLVKTRYDLKLQTPYNSSLSQRSVYLSFSECSTEITSTKIFQVHSGMNTLLTLKKIVSTEKELPRIISFMWSQFTLKINWCTLIIKYLHIYQCTLLLDISVH